MKKVTDMKACGSLVLVELLNAEEAIETQLMLSQNTKLEAPQAYVVHTGPNFDTKAWGFTVGDRVVFSGSMVPLPKLGERQRGVIDPHTVKAVLVS